MVARELHERKEEGKENPKKAERREERQGGVLDSKKEMEIIVRREEGRRGKRVKGDKTRV